MADIFDQQKWIEKRKAKRQATPGMLVMETLKAQKASNEATAVSISAFKDLPLSSETIAFTIVNMMDGGYVIRTTDEKYYFDDQAYKQFEKKTLNKAYSYFIVPIILFVIFFLIMGGTISLFK
jgi:hypothetical protein